MTITVDVSGGRALEVTLFALGNPAAARRAARAALEPSAEAIRAKAASLAPNDPATAGNLRESVQRKTNAKGDVVRVRIGINSDQDPAQMRPRKSGRGSYRDPGVAGNAVIQEFGTAEMAANPFMRPAWDAAKGGLIAEISAALGPEIEKAAARLARRAAR